jgi:inorganic pyrophosphatase
MMDTNKLEPGSSDKINVFITSEKGSKDYCEFDQRSGAFILRKILSRPFPGFYGFVPRTHNIDAEPLCAIVLTVEKLRQDMVIQARPIGLIRLKGAVPEDVLVTVLINDSFIKTQDLLTLDEEELEELKNFLEELKGERFQDVFGAEHAIRSFEHSVELYKKEFQ